MNEYDCDFELVWEWIALNIVVYMNQKEGKIHKRSDIGLLYLKGSAENKKRE